MSSLNARQILVSCLAAILFAAATPLARASDWYVDVNDPNCASGTGGPNDPFCTIGAAVSAAANGDTIHIAAGTYLENLVLDKSLTLLGTNGAASTIVDGASAGTVITITAAAVVSLEGLTITHGAALIGGGLEIDSSSDVTISECIVTVNAATGSTYVDTFGGGVYVLDATLTVLATSITNNTAVYGGGIRNDGGTVSLVDTIVSGNHTSYQGYVGAGAGIDNGGTLHLTNSKITSNHDDSESVDYSAGGGIVGGVVDGSGVEISSNHVAGSGGGIANATLALTDSLIEDNDAAWGGGIDDCTGTLEASVIRGNVATGGSSYGSVVGGTGGGAYLHGTFAFTECLFENNTARGNGSLGGGAWLTDGGSSVTLDRCTLRGNIAQTGAGAMLSANPFSDSTSIVLRDCAVIDNSASFGGGLSCSTPLRHQTIQLLRCTLGGNSAGVDGGGLSVDPHSKGSVTIDHTIVAGNSTLKSGAAPDCDGTLTSNGYNCIGDTTGCTVTGDGTGNLLDVDPLYADPANGDFTLQPASPCLDAGDPAQEPGGKDAAGHPRLLDGNLDRVMVLDMGAYEFDNVNLVISGSATPNGTLTFDTTGTSGLPVLMVAGAVEGEIFLRPFGSLFIDLTTPPLVVPWGTIPNLQSYQIPASIPVPSTVFFQELAIYAPTHSGNLGNVVGITIE